MHSSRQPISFIATDKPDAAKGFFTDILGLTLREATPFALVFSDGAQILRVQIVQQVEPAAYTAHGWQVADIKAEITSLEAKGVAFLNFDRLDQDADGVWTTPDGHKIAWFTDPSGNILSLTQDAGGGPTDQPSGDG